MAGWNLRDIADAGPGTFAQGLAQGIQSGTTMFQNERRLTLEEQARAGVLLERQLKLVEAMDAHPDKAAAIAELGKRHGIDVSALATPSAVDPERALIKLQAGGITSLSEDEQKALVHGARRDKSGVFRQSVSKALEGLRTDREGTAFTAAVQAYQAANPGMSYEDASAQVARTKPEYLRAYAGKDGAGYKATAMPQLPPDQKQLADARPKIAAVVDLVERGKMRAEDAYGELMALPGGKEAIAASPTLAAHANRMKARAGEIGKAEALEAPVGSARPRLAPSLMDVASAPDATAPAAASAGPRRLALPGMEQSLSFGDFRPQLDVGGIRNLADVASDTPSAPRTVGQVKADQAKREANAKVTPVDEKNAASRATSAAAAAQSAATGAAREQRLATAGERVAATIKTLEADAVKVAQQTFPDEKDATKRRALLEWMNARLKGLGSLATADKDPAVLQQELDQAIAKLKGEVEATPEGPSKRAAAGWLSRFIAGITGGGESAAPAPPAGAPAARPVPGRGAPARPAPAA
ncbi:MAG TPA: hypothetical protein VEA38_00310, partial [Terriglobales bacterium]|nr:hypothetical protein [Terriglobales bacterium]